MHKQGVDLDKYYEKVFSKDTMKNVEFIEPGMRKLEGKFITVFYENEEDAAKDVFNLAEEENVLISKTLGFDEPLNIKIYVYDKKETFQSKRLGCLAPNLNLNWYVGDVYETSVLLLSPASLESCHDYETIKNTAAHEIAHVYTRSLNHQISLWLDEGLAGYLSKQTPTKDFSKYFSFPTISQTHVKNNMSFAISGGYQFSYTYVDYLIRTYGLDKTIKLVKTGSYENTFGKTEQEIYNDWKVSFAV